MCAAFDCFDELSPKQHGSMRDGDLAKQRLYCENICGLFCKLTRPLKLRRLEICVQSARLFLLRHFRKCQKLLLKMGDFLGVFSNNEVVAFARFVESVDTTNLSNALDLVFDSQESFEERLQTCVKHYPHLEKVFCVMTKMRVFAGILQVAKVGVTIKKTENI